MEVSKLIITAEVSYGSLLGLRISTEHLALEDRKEMPQLITRIKKYHFSDQVDHIEIVKILNF